MPNFRLHLVDASPYIFRAYFALPSTITDGDGEPVNAVYGFGNFLLKLIADEQISHIALAFDGSLTSSFRNHFYPPYKQQRELPPPELERQQRRCQQLADALGIQTLISDRYEAEDLLASVAARPAASSLERVVVSSDKDLLQMVDDRTTVFDLARDQRYGTSDVVDKLGVRPTQVPDYLGLAGDSVDNIPGVPGVGPKTAAALLDIFPTLESMLDKVETVADLSIRGAKSLAIKLERYREQALLSKRLATLHADAELPFELADLEPLRLRTPEPDPLDAVLTELGFDSFRKRISH